MGALLWAAAARLPGTPPAGADPRWRRELREFLQVQGVVTLVLAPLLAASVGLPGWVSLPVNAVGRSADEFCQYIDFIADRRLAGCGLPALNPGATNPLPWLAEMMDVRKEQNFFEGKVTDYQKSSALSNTSDDDL